MKSQDSIQDQIAELQDIIERFEFDETEEGCQEYLKENLPEDDESDEVLRLCLVIEYWELVYDINARIMIAQEEVLEEKYLKEENDTAE